MKRCPISETSCTKAAFVCATEMECSPLEKGPFGQNPRSLHQIDNLWRVFQNYKEWTWICHPANQKHASQGQSWRLPPVQSSNTTYCLGRTNKWRQHRTYLFNSKRMLSLHLCLSRCVSKEVWGLQHIRVYRYEGNIWASLEFIPNESFRFWDVDFKPSRCSAFFPKPLSQIVGASADVPLRADVPKRWWQWSRWMKHWKFNTPNPCTIRRREVQLGMKNGATSLSAHTRSKEKIERRRSSSREEKVQEEEVGELQYRTTNAADLGHSLQLEHQMDAGI